MFRFSIGIVLFFVSLTALAQQQKPQEPPAPKTYGESFTVFVDNDSRNVGGPNADQGYTNGLRFAYVWGEDQQPEWMPDIPGFKDARSNYGISLAQQIYTPDDTQRTDLIPDDRPYAGYLYVGLTAVSRTKTQYHSWELDIGVVGPSAMGEKVQNNFHDWIQNPRAQGWEHQLKDEPTLELSYIQKLRFYEQESMWSGRYFDVIPEGGAEIGNVKIDAHMGAMVRFGLRLPDDFGPSNLSSVGGDALDLKFGNVDLPWRAYGFMGVRGRAVIRNIFLDGNTFKDSHRVKKYPFIGETEIGYAIQVSHWVYSWRFITLTPEFEENSEFDSYASLALSYVRNF
ncbi:hypothetical protein AZI86_14220 [Bdellovibrio bacteriovorus]|uniref:Lipid A deacylase LpxR family protein n=1 Tax=Bdellovibrio bacteriovorus TaxID=959 RepID=A0A150WK94_BDEBC|nr:lipid A deacylase LpxR family protein [Bdellovibrio bacteriovorus]KYG63961.1 hypothetical protein AZI86_14220 [Bdellovibrio bacteriovorus]